MVAGFSRSHNPVRVLCCFAADAGLRPHPRTAESLKLCESSADVYIKDATGDPLGYWQNIREYWNGEDDLVVVEHDNAFTAQQFQSFSTCSQPWCLFDYWHPAAGGGGLGFCRFRKELMLRVPCSEVALNRFVQDSGSGVPWIDVANRLFRAVRRYHYAPHKHGTAEHYHDEYHKDQMESLSDEERAIVKEHYDLTMFTNEEQALKRTARNSNSVMPGSETYKACKQ